MSRRAKLWAAWIVLAFGVFNIYGPDLSAYRRADDPPGISAGEILLRLNRGQLLLSVLRDDSDTRRYFAYADAVLGRPAPKYFIRQAEDWRAAETESLPKPEGLTEAGKPLVPWRDFSVEYPPLMLPFVLLPALPAGDFSTFHFLFSLEMELLLTLAVLFAVKAADRLDASLGDSSLAWSLASLAALGVVAVRRYDAVVSLAASAALFGLVARRPIFSGAAWATGVAAKGAPVILAPLALLWYWTRGDFPALWRASLAAVLTLGLAGAAFLALAGAHYADPFAYHAARPLQFESFWGGLLIAAQAFDPDIATTAYSFGSDNIVSAYEPLLRRVASLAPALAILAVYVWAFLRLRREPDGAGQFSVLAAAACACFVAFATLGKVFSPQYLVWLIPLGALASLRAEGARKWLIAALALAQFEYPFLYSSLSAATEPLFGFVILARNLALWGWIILLLRAPAARTA